MDFTIPDFFPRESHWWWNLALQQAIPDDYSRDDSLAAESDEEGYNSDSEDDDNENESNDKEKDQSLGVTESLDSLPMRMNYGVRK